MTSEAADFFTSTVEPTVSEFLGDLKDVRRGRLAAIVLSHMADYLAAERGTSPSHVRDEISKQCPEFSLIRDISDATKHARLSRKASLSSSRQITSSPGILTATFGIGLFGEAVVVFATLDDGTAIELGPTVRTVMEALRGQLSGIKK